MKIHSYYHKIENYFLVKNDAQVIIFITFLLFSYKYLLIYDFNIFKFNHLFWFDYADQRKYYISAKALLDFDFSSSKHNYPLGYQLFALPFVLIFNFHGYFILSFILLLFFYIYFYKLSFQVTGSKIFSLFIILFLSSYNIVFMELITPWTNNLVLATYSIFVYKFFKNQNESQKILNVVFLIIIFTRPIDSLILIPFYIYFILKVSKKKNFRSLFKLIFIPILIILIFIFVNYEIHGSSSNTYVINASKKIFDFHNYFLKLISLIFNGDFLYNESQSMLIKKFPWICFIIPFFFNCLKNKSKINLIIIFSVIISFVIYSSFSPINSSSLHYWGTMRTFNLSIFYINLLSLGYLLKLINLKKFKTIFVTSSFFFIFFSMLDHGFFIAEKKINSKSEINLLDNYYFIKTKKNSSQFNKIEIRGLTGKNINDFNQRKLIRLYTNDKCLTVQNDYSIKINDKLITIIFNKKINLDHLFFYFNKNMFVEKIFDLNNFELDISLVEICIFCKKNISKKIHNKKNIIYLNKNNTLDKTANLTTKLSNQPSIENLKLFCNDKNYIELKDLKIK